MIIFNIFKIRKLYKEVRENPGKVTSGELGSALPWLIIVPMIIFEIALLLLFVFGFTNLFFGVSLFAKILFYIFLPVYIVIIFFVIRILKKIKKFTESTTNKTIDKIKS